uniref:PARP1-like PADR1 domain-containing protein n=1 Tax=Oryza brachyantha TaxID=4533 RepID=J3KTZ5_ORYBR
MKNGCDWLRFVFRLRLKGKVGTIPVVFWRCPQLQILRNSQAGRSCHIRIKESFLILSRKMLLKQGSKCKNSDNDMHDCKAPKIDRSILEGAQNKGKAVVSCESNASYTDLQEKLKEHSDTLWKLKDELKKHVSTAELRNMLDIHLG